MNCDTNYFSLLSNLRAMARISGSLVGPAMVLVQEGSHTEQAIRCGAENGHMTFENFMQASIGTDGDGLPAIRVKLIQSTQPQITCATNDDINSINQFFAYDSTTKTYALVLNLTV